MPYEANPKKRGRPRKETSMDVVLTIRVAKDISDDITVYTEVLSHDLAYMGLDVTKASAIRRLITVGLVEERKRLGY